MTREPDEAALRGYQGRLWDAPMTDGMSVVDLTGLSCHCGKKIAVGDDAVMLGSAFHIECLLRSTMGDLAHLQGQCSCFGGGGHDVEGAYREQAQRALQWLIDNGRGRWA